MSSTGSLGLSEESAAVTSSESAIPEKVLGTLKTQKIGYLSVVSKKGDLYSYPLAFHYSKYNIYLMTVKDSSKIKFMKANPNVSFLVDNKKIALECCGAMIQGKAKILSMTKMIGLIYTLGPKSLLEWSKKYPGLLTFYAKGKDIPEERRLYKYRFIRVEPSKIVFWDGYKFGKYIPEKKSSGVSDITRETLDPTNPESLANLLATVDEEVETDELPANPDWYNELNTAVSSGMISEDEKRVISMSKGRLLGVAENVKPGELSSGEKALLKKWKASKSNN